MYRRPSTTLQNSTPKREGKKPKSIFQEAIYHGIIVRTSSTYEVFGKLLWKPSKDVSQMSSCNQISLPIFQGLTRIQFRSPMVTPPLTLARSRIRVHPNVTLTPRDGTKTIKVDSCITDQIFSRMEKAPEWTEETIMGSKHCSAVLLTR